MRYRGYIEVPGANYVLWKFTPYLQDEKKKTVPYRYIQSID